MGKRFRLSRNKKISLILALFFLGSDVVGAEESNTKSIEPQKSMRDHFGEGTGDYRFPIPAEFEFAYIDRTGKVVISGPFTCAESFHNGRAVVRLGSGYRENGKWKFQYESYTDPLALLDTNGKIIMPERRFGTINPFFDSTCTASAIGLGQGAHVILDKQGKVIRELKTTKQTSDAIGALSEGLAFLSDTSGSPGFTDTTGNIKFKTEKDLAASRFSEGMAKVRRAWWVSGLPPQLRMTSEKLREPAATQDYSQKIDNWMDTTIGYINRDGQLKIPIQFQQGRDFHEGLAAVKKNGKWGYVNQSGSIVIPTQYALGGDFGEGLAPVANGDKTGFIDGSGKEKIQFKFAAAKEFAAGLAPASLNGRDWGFIDKSGTFIIPPIFKQAFPFDSERALVFIKPTADSFDVDKSPLAPAMFYQSGMHAKRSLAIEEARKSFKKVVELDPESEYAIKAKRMLATALPAKPVPQEIVLAYSSAAGLQKSSPEKALETLKDCIKKCPDFEWPYAQAASACLDLKRPDEAVDLLNTVLKKNKNYMRGHLWLAEALKAKGDSAGAAREIEIARHLNPDDELLLMFSITNPTTK